MKNILLLCIPLILFGKLRAQTECINYCNNVYIDGSVPTWNAYITYHQFYNLDFESGRHYRISFNEPAILNGLNVSVNGTTIDSGDDFDWSGGNLEIDYSFDENTALFQTATMNFTVEKRTLLVWHIVSVFEFKVFTTCFPNLVLSSPVIPLSSEVFTKYEVNDYISASAEFSPNTCGCDGDIWMDAGTYVELLPGFKTTLVGGGSVDAFIDGCGGSRSMETTDHFNSTPISTAQADRSSFIIYPNPTTGNLNVQIDDWGTEMIDIKVQDISGRILVDRKISPTSTYNFDISGYSKGIYIVTLTNGSTVKTQKVILE